MRYLSIVDLLDNTITQNIISILLSTSFIILNRLYYNTILYTLILQKLKKKELRFLNRYCANKIQAKHNFCVALFQRFVLHKLKHIKV